MSRLLFLSHSGIDTEAASAIKKRLLSAPAARDLDLNVWFDKDDLKAGQPWQPQLEDAIAKSHAFAVYVGSRGVVNWVEAEVRLALNRAITDPDYRFIPVLAKDAPGPEALPGFAQQFQGVCDVETTPGQFEALMGAVLGVTEGGQLQLEANPFFGLCAIDESRSHLFFGRGTEADALVELLSRTPLVLVTGDSGSGKSSLVRAGVVPRFRGGALALLDGARPEDTIWHVVTTRPRNQPFRQLGDAVDQAAKGLGLSLADRGALADWAASGDRGKVRRALRCDLPPEHVRVLLVVDQLEELLTITPSEFREPYVDLLLDLADPADGRHRVMLTMRHDYVNLCNGFDRLKDRLEADDRRARFRLGRMSDDGLRSIVTEPLRLAGVDAPDREALAHEVLRDVGERPGDLALVQMALTEAWQARREHGGTLLRAYTNVGRVEGALAQAAERVRTQVLDDGQRSHLDSILLRLVRLGDTGGATRRIAARDEFDDARWPLIQTLASEDGKRLVLLGGGAEHPTVEIAHEALVSAWPYFQTLLQNAAEDKRVFDALIPRAQMWVEGEDQAGRDKRLATGADLEVFAALLHRRPGWVSSQEQRFIRASMEMEERRQRRDRNRTRALQAVAATLLVAFALAGWMWWRATDAESLAVNERNKATEAATLARQNEKMARASESRALAALSEIAASEYRAIDAVKLAIASWPRSPDGDPPKLRTAIEVLGATLPKRRLLIPPMQHRDAISGAEFNGDGNRILTWSEDATARLWDVSTGKELLPPLQHGETILGAMFNGDGNRILTWSEDNTARLWNADTGEAVLPPLKHSSAVLGAVFNRDETRILTWSWDDTARLWDANTGEAVLPPLKHSSAVLGAAFNRDETRFLTWSEGKTARLWNAATGQQVLPPLQHQGIISGAEFNGDGTRILTWSEDTTARLWDANTGKELLPPLQHGDTVTGAVFNRDETRILTWSADKNARLWNADTGQEVLPPLKHSGAVTGAVFNRDETRILTWSWGVARLWDADTGQEAPPLNHRESVLGAVFSGDGTHILTWSRDHTARLWDAVTVQDVLLVLQHKNAVKGAVFNKGETRILTWSEGKTARLWNAATGQQVLPSLRHQGIISGAEFNGDGTRILTWSEDTTARLWDANTGKELLPPLQHGETILGAMFNGDGNRILTWSEDNTARLWNADTGEAVLPPLKHSSAVLGAVFNRDETRILTWSWDDTARLWDANTGKELLPPLKHSRRVLGAVFNGDETHILTWSLWHPYARLWDAKIGAEIPPPLQHQGDILGAVFNEEGTRILTWSADKTARLWDADTGQEILPPLKHWDTVVGAAFNGDGTRILTWSNDNTARLWDADTGREVLPPLKHWGAVTGAVFNRDETRILTWSWDDTARLWDAGTGQEILPPLQHKERVLGAVFSQNETRILTWSADKNARLWDISRLPPGNLMDLACEMLPEHDTGELEERYGIAISESICGPDTPAPVWTELVD